MNEERGLAPPKDGCEGVWEKTNVRYGGHRVGHSLHILVMGDDSRGLARALTEDVALALPNLCLNRIDGPENLIHHDSTLKADDHVVLGLATSEVEDIDTALELAKERPIPAPANWLIVTDEITHFDLVRSTTPGRLASLMSVPWAVELLIGQSYSTMVNRLKGERRTPEEILELIGEAPANAIQGPIPGGLDLKEEQAVHLLLEGVERVLGHRPRLVTPTGTEFAVQGQPVRATYLVLAGDVSLHRDGLRGEVLAHHATSGPLIGPVSLARGKNVLFTTVTTSTARVVRLTNEQLEIALLRKPALATPLAVLAIQSLTRRLMRAEGLHLENALLTADLEAQRMALEKALEDLRTTREQLVEKIRSAMLDKLPVGIAYELNNPVTVLARAAEHLSEDVDRVLATVASFPQAREAMHRVLESSPRSISEKRELVKLLLPEVGGDRRLARRLVLMGVADPVRARGFAQAGEFTVEILESGARIGSSLRPVLAVAEWAIDLTHPLKGYARPDAADFETVNVSAGIDDVLRLTDYRPHGVEVIREGGPLPPIPVHPSKLQQVWTNLIVNAAEAIEDEHEDLERRRKAGEEALFARGAVSAQIRILLEEEGTFIRVTIEDNGPGTTPEIVKKIFEPHFTTKTGRVRYGLGMGTFIVHSIVSDHGGRLTVESQPGRTCIIIRLPAVKHEKTPKEETW